MDPTTIALLINTLGPIIIPLLANGLVWLFTKLVGAISPTHMQVISPFLPLLAGAIGTALGISSGGSALQGLVGGLAATGIHQAVTQPMKAVNEDAGQGKAA